MEYQKLLSTKDITKAIDSYLGRYNTQYAVMINGSWGVGKTHFIQNNFIDATKDGTFFYISLYGLATIKDIENEFLKTLEFKGDASDLKHKISHAMDNEISHHAEIGGISYFVKHLLRLHSDRAKKEKKVLTICFDDLERWYGDFNICLSYINRLVEHENIKCILIGNIDEFSDAQGLAFTKAKEKTVRHIYRLNVDVHTIFKIALSQVGYGSQTSKRFVRSVVLKNAALLETVMARIDNTNIRIVIEALQLYEYIYRNNTKSFNTTKSLAFTYLVTLLSALILVKKYLTKKKIRDDLLNGDHSRTQGYSFLKKIGYFDEISPEYLTDESRLLLDIVFYRLDKISLNGLFSIIYNGFYIKADFQGDFDKWVDEDLFENFLDAQFFYQLEDNEATQISEHVIQAAFVDRLITNPVTLLLLIERVIHDIEKGVIDFNLDQCKKMILDTINFLYSEKEMDLVEINFYDVENNRFQNCLGIYNYVKESNVEYLSAIRSNRLANFWKNLRKNPDHLSRLAVENSDGNVFSQYAQPEEIIESLSQLSNAKLFEFIDQMDRGRINTSIDELTKKEESKARFVAQQINLLYEGKNGLRASHFRHIAALILGRDNHS